MIVINLFATVAFCWMVLFLNHKFLRPVLLNRTRFKLFALRDQLATLAMEGVISTKAKEYKYLMLLINRSIKEFDNFSIVSYIKFISSSIQSDHKVKNVIKLLEEHPDSRFKMIFANFCQIIYNVFLRQTFLFRFTFMPLVKLIVKNCRAILKINKTVSTLIVDRTKKIEEIESIFESTHNALTA